MLSEKPPVIALVGATATGKTALAENLADRLGAEIVCADSRQVFRELEVGTGKPTRAERAQRPHHLFEAISINEHASAGWYADAAARVCGEIQGRHRLPVLVGGSGLYLEALRSGLSGAPPRAPEIRARLRAELEAGGPELLHRRLAAIDPPSASRLEPGDAQRIIRALEVYEASGCPLSWWHAQGQKPPFAAQWTVLEVTAPPHELAVRIAHRTRQMFEAGLIEEVRALAEADLEQPLRRLRAVGYDEALELIAGKLSRDQAEERINARTRQLAKRQRTWFRHRLESISIDGTLDFDSLVRRSSEVIEERRHE